MTAVWVNGRPADSIAADDRGLHYGDGLFETLAVTNGQAIALQDHMERLRKGCRQLGLERVPLEEIAAELRQRAAGHARAVIKLVLTAGSGLRGYLRGAGQQLRWLTIVSEMPAYDEACYRDGVRVKLCDLRLARQPRLAGCKHLNRLEQVLARSEWAGNDYAEGLLRNTQGQVISATMSNVFMVRGDRVHTPSLADCGVAGTMRGRILRALRAQGRACEVAEISLSELLAADEIFLSNALIGVWPVRSIDRCEFNPGPLARELLASCAPWRVPA